MKNKYLLFSLFLLLFSANLLQAQSFRRGVALLDCTGNSGDPNLSYIYAVDHLLKVCGVDYIQTTSVDTAANYSMIVVSSRIYDNSFDSNNQLLLSNYVNNGGILIASSFAASNASTLENVFGVTLGTARVDRHLLSFDISTNNPALRWINDPNEQTISLGKITLDTVITSRSYIPTTAQVLANYDDGSVAITQNIFGLGKAYNIGITFRDMIGLPQSKSDYEAQRTYSNGFEPSADALILFIKAIYAQNVPYAVWKHTIPNKKKTALLLTHDMDSQTAMDLVTDFASYERSKEITTIYNITTRYYGDYLMSAFFLPASGQMKLDSARTQYGHVLGCHSVGHFPDFYDVTNFPVGYQGQFDSSNYHPVYHENGLYTSGGTVFGETEVSKLLIENRFGINVRSFRAGHLAFNKYLINVLDTLGYDFNSSMSANDVLSAFPYRARTSQSNFGTFTNVYEIPMTISDVFPDAPFDANNWSSKVDIWKDVITRNAANYAINVLLIHPNQPYKLYAEKKLINEINYTETDFSGFEAFGDFWRYRDSLEFTSTFVGGELHIIIPANELPIQHKMGFVVDKTTGFDTSKIKVLSSTGSPVPHFKFPWYENSTYIMFEPYVEIPATVSVAENKVIENKFEVKPNPFTDQITVGISSDKSGKAQIVVTDLTGKKVFTGYYSISQGSNNIQIEALSQLSRGLYILSCNLDGSVHTTKILKQ